MGVRTRRHGARGRARRRSSSRRRGEIDRILDEYDVPRVERDAAHAEDSHARRTARLPVALALCSLAGCERETRRSASCPRRPHRAPTRRARRALRARRGRSRRPTVTSPYQENAYGVSRASGSSAGTTARLPRAAAAAAIGPPLMDDSGSTAATPDQIYATIVEGRPNGMPSFGGRIPEQQVWQLVAYVRSLSGQMPQGRGAEPQRRT